MPELPEVETIARGLASRVRGDVIESVWLGSKPEPLKSPALEIAATLENKRISGVRRMGKHIVFDLESLAPKRAPAWGRSLRSAARGASLPAPPIPGDQWIVHLGMTGRLLVCPPDAEPVKHTHAVLRLASNRELRFIDPRRFGRLSVAHGFRAAGVEPLEVEGERFIGLFRGRKTPIKSALLNQKLLGGVGNIYADESLFRAAIRPRREPVPEPAKPSEAAPGGAGSAPRGDCARRVFGFRLRGCGTAKRDFSSYGTAFTAGKVSPA